MENLRQRRQARELENAHKFALDGFVRELLQVRDSLELGYDAAHAPGADIAKLREGTELTLKLMADTMTKFGVEVVAPEGEPIQPGASPGHHPGTAGRPAGQYRGDRGAEGHCSNGRLVRPAMVIVSRQA